MPLLTAGAFSIYDRHTWKQYTDRKLIQGVISAPDFFALIDGLARGRSRKAQSLQMNKLMTREEIRKNGWTSLGASTRDTRSESKERA